VVIKVWGITEGPISVDDICVWQKYFSKNIEPLEINEDYKERIL